MPVSPDVKLNAPALRQCFECHEGAPSPSCVAALESVRASVCAEGMSAEELKAAAAANYAQDPKAWCDAKCDFKNISKHFEQGGLTHDDVLCMQLPHTWCHEHLMLDQMRRQRIADGSISREEVAHPPGHFAHVPPMSEEQHTAMKAAEGEDPAVTSLRVATHHLKHVLAHRDDATSPPLPRMCAVCDATGVTSHACFHEAETLAAKVCVDGTESLLCAQGGPMCFPYPKLIAEHLLLEREEHENALTEEQRRHLSATPSIAPPAGGGGGDGGTGTGASRLSHTCVNAVLETCARGIVVPTISLRPVHSSAREGAPPPPHPDREEL